MKPIKELSVEDLQNELDKEPIGSIRRARLANRLKFLVWHG